MNLRNLARLGLGILLLTGLVAGGVHAQADVPRPALAIFK